MKFQSSIIPILAILFLAGCATDHSERPPRFTLKIPPTFNYSTGITQYKTGDYLYKNPLVFVKKANCPVTARFGLWKQAPESETQSPGQDWNVRVALTSGSKVLDGYNRAKDGYDAKVDEEHNYMFARFERKTFSWGKGFSYFTQFTQDGSTYVPHNGHLTYEIWGVTNDQKHVVHAACFVIHHSLAKWGPDVRDAHSIQNLKKDRDYVLIESCNPMEFQPPLADMDKLVGSLRLK